MSKKWIVLLLALTGVASICFICHSFQLKHISIDGLTRYTEEEFKEYLELNFFTELTPVFCVSDEWKQKQIPFIEKYEIEYLDKNSAKVVVHEKRVTGCVPVMGRYMYFDKDGIVVESSSERIESVPVIAGLEFTEISLFKKLQIQKESLYDKILQLTRLIESNKIVVEEIAFDSNYEVTLQTGTVTVKLGKRENYDEQVNALQGILAEIELRTGTLDMRNYSKENQDVIFK